MGGDRKGEAIFQPVQLGGRGAGGHTLDADGVVQDCSQQLAFVAVPLDHRRHCGDAIQEAQPSANQLFTSLGHPQQQSPQIAKHNPVQLLIFNAWL